MSVRRPAPPEQQPKDFVFTADKKPWADQQIKAIFDEVDR